MKISVKVNKGDWGATKALANVVFDGSFCISGIRTMQGEKGLFVAMPSKKLPNGEYKDIAFPITKEFRAELQKEILAAYNGAETEEEYPF